MREDDQMNVGASNETHKSNETTAERQARMMREAEAYLIQPNTENKGVDILQTLSDEGMPKAMAYLGAYRLKRTRDPRVQEESMALVKKSAEQGDVFGLFNLGSFEIVGWGIAKDLEGGLAKMSEAAENGPALLQTRMGDIYFYEDTGVPIDYKQAVYWYSKAAEQGELDGQYELAKCYCGGLGVTQSCAKAVEWYRKAAEQGHPEAQYCMGQCCTEGRAFPADMQQAAIWYEKAAEQGDIDAEGVIGLFYLEGQGVPKDQEKGFSWLLKAAKGGHVQSATVVGICYLQGKGVAPNKRKALRWLRRAALRGNRDAQMILTTLKTGIW